MMERGIMTATRVAPVSHPLIEDLCASQHECDVAVLGNLVS